MTAGGAGVHVHVNGRFLTQPITGVQRYGAELLAAIDRLLAASDPAVQDLRVTVHTPEGPRVRDLALHAIGVARRGPGGGHLWEQLVLPRQVPDGVLFCPGNTAPIVSLLGAVPVVVTVHDLSFRYFPEAYAWPFRGLYRMLTPLIMNRAVRVVTVSESERAAILSHYPRVAGRLEVIQNGGGLTEAAVTALTPDQAPMWLPARYLLYVGSLSHRKNFPGVVRTFVRLAAEDPTLFLVVAGGATQAFRAADAGVPEAYRSRVVLLGQVNRVSVLAELYRRAACFVFPSFYEASPLPPVEAMSFGCPVVASSIPSTRERCGDAAEYCDPGDVDSIVTAVRHVLGDVTAREALRARGRRRAAMFTWEEAARRMVGILRQAAGRWV